MTDHYVIYTRLTLQNRGEQFLVHPLDITSIGTDTVTINGQSMNVTYCYNNYQYLTLDPTAFAGFDAALGDGFLRNVYAR